MKIDNLSNEVKKQLKLLEENVRQTVEKQVDDVAKESKQMIKNIGGYGNWRGKYRKGFRLENTGNYRTIKRTLRNTEYRLTHLLEHGHATADGTGRAKTFPHWEQTEKFMREELEKRLTRELGK